MKCFDKETKYKLYFKKYPNMKFLKYIPVVILKRESNKI